ncbi:MAG: acetylornithine transaminase [Chloroflexi bacterium]|nr:acetylornithine transaminase [Chloroflexota bacterium]
MNTNEIISAERRYLVQTYVRPDMVLSHGEGCTLWDCDGRRYLDFMAGIAVVALGHADAEWAAAVQAQAGRLAHVSNLFHTAPHVELARRLVENSFADRVFFGNSGSEANEAALKFARKAAKAAGHEGKTGIVAFTGSFHGRTMGALAVTAKEAYRAPFAPLVPGVTFAPFNDVEAARAAIGPDTCAVIVEPVQGEGGVNPATGDFLQALRAACDEHGALLIFDEVQCGLGRTGTLWAHEAYGVAPDMMTLAKPLANGLPIGVVLVTEAVAGVLQPGDHGSTFGAGPLVCAAACVVFDRVSAPAFLADVREKGAYLLERLNALDSPHITAVRGCGLLVGVELDEPVAPILAAARERGLLIINAGTHVIRLAPPLVVTKEQIDEAVELLAVSLKL